MNSVKISDYFKPSPGDYDGMHSFESRTKDGFGGKMHTKINTALKDFYKTNKLNPSISAINIVMNDKIWEVKWEVLIEESKDGKAYIGLTSRGGAGTFQGPQGSINRAQKQYDKKIKNLKTEISPKTETKLILDFKFQSKTQGYGIRQIFAMYTNPTKYPPFNYTITSSAKIINGVTGQPLENISITQETESNSSNPPPTPPISQGNALIEIYSQMPEISEEDLPQIK